MTPPGPCAACGRELACAKRVIDGARYCGTCAKRLLRRMPCSRCGKTTTWPKDAADPVCPACRVGDRTCVRCGRAGRPVGLVLPFGVACASCAPYLRPARPCAYCGASSHTLTRRPGLGLSEPACPKCQRAREGHATCPRCGKNRKLSAGPGGLRLCRRCRERGDRPFVCPACGKAGPYHSKRECVPCYWKRTLPGRLERLAGRLALAWSRALLEGCVDALLAKGAEPRALSLRLPRYAAFCASLDAHFPDPRQVTGAALLERYGADGLRRHAVVAAYLARVLKLALPDQVERRAHSEARRQARVLERAGPHWYAPLLESYHASRQKAAATYAARRWTGGHARLVPRTLTSGVRCAERFLAGLDPETFAALPAKDSIRRLTQADVEAFAARHPGYRAAIGNFLEYVNRDIRGFRRLRPVCFASGLRPELLLDSTTGSALLQAWQDGNAPPRTALAGLLMLALGLRPAQLARLTLADVVPADDGSVGLRTGKRILPLPPEIGRGLFRYLDSRRPLAVLDRPAGNPYLFPGRSPGQPLHPDSLTRTLRRQGLRAERLFATALLNLFRCGLDNPRVLIDALGLAIPTVIKYFEASGRAVQWQITDYCHDQS